MRTHAGKADLYGAFTLRNIELVKSNGHVGMITIPNWMFLSSFEQLRGVLSVARRYLARSQRTRGHGGRTSGAAHSSCVAKLPRGLSGRFLRLFDKQGSVSSNDELERRFTEMPASASRMLISRKIPGGPIAYWVSAAMRKSSKSEHRLEMLPTPGSVSDRGQQPIFEALE